MSQKLIYYMLLCVASFSQASQWQKLKHGRHNINNRISDGSDVEIDQVPYMAYLKIGDGNQTLYECTGTIVSDTCIITSGRCLDGAKFVRVRLGSTSKSMGGIYTRADSFSKHPQYDRNTQDFDIGIVTFEKGIALNGNTISTIGVESISNDPEEGEMMTIIGWGATKDGGETSEVLQQAKVPVINRNDCRATYKGVNGRMFCAGGGKANICPGDYGGPAIGQAHLLSGVASYSDSCGKKNVPGVYTRVGHPLVRPYITFICGV